MTSTHDHVDYLSFLRGYAAAMNHDAACLATEPPAYAEGFAAAAQPVEDIVRYRDLSLSHDAANPGAGSFHGTLADLLRPRQR